MIIAVTQEDIESGQAYHCTFCPVALAVHRLFPEKKVMVTKWFVWLNESQCELPDCAVNWVCDFDMGRPVQPITFELPI